MNTSPLFFRGSDLMLRIEVFDWTSPDERTQISFHVTAMQVAIQQGTLPFTKILVQMDNNFAREWLPQRELDMPYVLKLTPERLKVPVMGIRLPDAEQSVVLIDGSHRYYRKYLNGDTVIYYNLIEFPHWLPFADIKGTWPCQ